MYTLLINTAPDSHQPLVERFVESVRLFQNKRPWTPALQHLWDQVCDRLLYACALPYLCVLASFAYMPA
jgi:hypothetical protein